MYTSFCPCSICSYYRCSFLVPTIQFCLFLIICGILWLLLLTDFVFIIYNRFCSRYLCFSVVLSTLFAFFFIEGFLVLTSSKFVARTDYLLFLSFFFIYFFPLLHSSLVLTIYVHLSLSLPTSQPLSYVFNSSVHL